MYTHGSLSLTPRRHFNLIWTGCGARFQSIFHLRPLLPPYCPSANVKSPYIVYCWNTEENMFYQENIFYQCSSTKETIRIFFSSGVSQLQVSVALQLRSQIENWGLKSPKFVYNVKRLCLKERGILLNKRINIIYYF